MKKGFALLISLFMVFPVISAETKEVCKPKMTKDNKEVLDKDKKPVMDCKKIKVHKKHEGTPVPSK